MDVSDLASWEFFVNAFDNDESFATTTRRASLQSQSQPPPHELTPNRGGFALLQGNPDQLEAQARNNGVALPTAADGASGVFTIQHHETGPG